MKNARVLWISRFHRLSLLALNDDVDRPEPIGAVYHGLPSTVSIHLFNEWYPSFVNQILSLFCRSKTIVRVSFICTHVLFGFIFSISFWLEYGCTMLFSYKKSITNNLQIKVAIDSSKTSPLYARISTRNGIAEFAVQRRSENATGWSIRMTKWDVTDQRVWIVRNDFFTNVMDTVVRT